MIQSTFRKNISVKKIRIRIILSSLCFALFFTVIGARAFVLHLTPNQKLNNLAKSQYRQKIVVAPKRGTIMDRNGEPLAMDIEVSSIYAVPSVIDSPRTFAKTLAPLLEISEKNILEKIKDKNKKFVWIKRRINENDGKKIKELHLTGLGLLPEYKRFYPNGSLASNLLGAVGMDAQALSGLEISYDKILKSLDPPLLVEKDAKGRSLGAFELAGKESPNNILLSIDKTIQYITERELATAMEKHRAAGGVAIVMEVHTGEILGMASSPTFNPNEYQKSPPQNWRNRGVTDAYEPGSIFKAFTAAAALETGVFNLKKTMNCENGAMKVGKFTINDHHGYGTLNLFDIMKYSSNICSYKLGQMVGKNRFYEFIQAFGFGKKTGVGIPGETSGLVAPLSQIGSLQLGTIAFGQGISVTPLQIVAAYAALANGGELYKPLLVKQTLDSKNKIIEEFSPQNLQRVIKEETAKIMAKMLETVTEEGGTGTAAQIEGYSVAGKTGTAQKVVEGEKGYAKNKYVASFVGFAPAKDPKLVVLVSIDEPKGDYYGGLVSAPVFKNIMEQGLTYLKVQPETELLAKHSAKKESKVKEPNIKKTVKDKSTAEITQPIVGTNEDKKKSTEENLENMAPNFTGLSVREALRRAQKENLKLKVLGSGICNEQDPRPGKTLAMDSTVTLHCSPAI